MRVLELFSGTGSITKYCKRHGHRAVSVDIDPACNPTVCCDILAFDYKRYRPGYFDVVWASPECKVYSSMQNANVGPGKRYKSMRSLQSAQRRDYKYTDRTLEIIRYLRPRKWFVTTKKHVCGIVI